MNRRYFVTVMASDQRALLALSKYELDIFRPTVKRMLNKGFSIQGLVTLDEIGMLADAGYQVLVEEESSKRARARQETVEFDEWIKEMEK